MRLIGVIGGMSAESTALYYQLFNRGVRQRLGGLHSAELLVRSVDFAPIADLQAQGAWNEAGARIAALGRQLEAAGAGLIVLATNTMHKVIEPLQAAVRVPVVHIADATAAALVAAGRSRPGLIATRFTMEQDFYVGRLRATGLAPLVPAEAERVEVHRIIYDELCQGRIEAASRRTFVEVAAALVARGADSLILGCTEVGLLLGAGDVAVPVFDTVTLHVEAALELALQPPAMPGQ